MPVVPILDKCHTLPVNAIHLRPTETIQWLALGESCSLSLPGNVFDGYDAPFTLPITATFPPKFQPVKPLKVRADAAPRTISDYIHDANGKNCMGRKRPGPLTDPPEIIIDSGIIPRRRKRRKR